MIMAPGVTCRQQTITGGEWETSHPQDYEWDAHWPCTLETEMQRESLKWLNNEQWPNKHMD